MRKTRKQRIAELTAPPPSLEFTLAQLGALAVRVPEAKARTRKAIEQSHRALLEVLQTLEAWSKYPDLVSRSTVEAIHKQIRRTLKLAAPEAAKLALADVLRDAD